MNERMDYRKANKALIKLSLLINSLCLIYFAYVAWEDHNKGCISTCAWIIIVLLYNYRDLRNYKDYEL